MNARACTRRHFLRALGLGAAGLALPRALRAAAPPARKLNFVFFLIDDMGWTDAGCYGSSFYETPGIDRLAASGMRFTDAYAACPVCSPTRASIMAGKYPARLNLTDWIGGRRAGKLIPPTYLHHLPLEETTVAEALKQAGYTTGFFGKWHLGSKGYYPDDQGFDLNLGGHERGSPPGGYFSPYRNPKLPDGPKGEYLTDRLTDEALRFLDANSGKPFLLYLSHYAVHTPLQSKKELAAKYQAKAGKLPAKEPRWGVEGSRKVRLVQDHPVYAGMVQSMDESVGSVLDRLEKLGLEGHTAVFFMSDNGGLSTSEGHPTSNLPLRAGKGWLYEGGIREPMIVRWPGVVRPGTTCSAPVISTDFYPTMLEMAGLPLRPEQHADGVSMVPLLKGAAALDRKAIFWHYPHYGNQGGSPGGAVRAGRYKLIEFYEDDHVELYDLGKDIGETTDLAEKMPEKAAELRGMLHEWRKSVDARMPTPNPNYGKAGPPRPSGKPPAKGAKDGEFAVLTNAAVDASPLGFALRTGENTDPALALRKLEAPITGKATFTVRLKSIEKRPVPPFYRNGFLAFGDGPADGQLIKCGLFLGGRRFLSMADGPLFAAARTEKPLAGDPLGEFTLKVEADLPAGRITCTAGGATATLKLARKLTRITHLGYCAINTTTAFSKVEAKAAR